MLLAPLGSTDLALLVLRVVFAACVFKHGWGKVHHIEDLEKYWNVPVPLAWVVAAIQILGAFSLALGLLTVPFAIALADRARGRDLEADHHGERAVRRAVAP